jgi:hypothetical protein
MLTHYLKTFSTLRSDTSRTRWKAATKFQTPHKPLLLLVVIDLIAQGI